MKIHSEEKNEFSAIDFDIIFPMQSSEFTKLLNSGKKLKKAAKKVLFFSNFHLKYCIDKKYIFNKNIVLSLIDLKQALPMKPSKFEIPLSVKSYD